MSPDTAADTAVASPPPPTNGNGDAQVEFIPKYSKYRIFTNHCRVEGGVNISLKQDIRKNCYFHIFQGFQIPMENSIAVCTPLLPI